MPGDQVTFPSHWRLYCDTGQYVRPLPPPVILVGVVTSRHRDGDTVTPIQSDSRGGSHVTRTSPWGSATTDTSTGGPASVENRSRSKQANLHCYHYSTSPFLMDLYLALRLTDMTAAVRRTEAHLLVSRELPLHEVESPKMPSTEAAISKKHRKLELSEKTTAILITAMVTVKKEKRNNLLLESVCPSTTAASLMTPLDDTVFTPNV
ncbi:hypothetical protein E2C01_028468 [Portunus trituberculatus]|uniref:Uncharacterized protein n=1 Tax=Portunus trituberculatus TaxID=210409 RepID=A0A5B7EPJ7_PORTR|nr:hypothetical protein [Portunus trituberculatus]